jgi:hypothetical protein
VGISGVLTARQLAGHSDNAGSGEVVDRIRVRVLPDGRMTRRDAARYLGFSEKTLAMWALSKKGPLSVRMGGRCWYYIGDLDEYLRAVRTTRG